MAVSSIPEPKKRNWAPYLIIGAILMIVIGRIIFLGTVSDRFNAAFFTRAITESFKLGSLYALIALGYTMVYGIIRLINFAHGEVFMVGAFATFFLFSAAPYPWPVAVLVAIPIAFGVMRILDFWRGKMTDPIVLAGGGVVFFIAVWLLSATTVNFVLALIFSMLITGVLGIFIDRIAYSPLRGAPRNSMLITAIAVSFFLQNFGLLTLTRRQTPFRPDTVLNNSLVFNMFDGTVRTSWLIVVIPLISLVLVIALTLFVTRTRLGKAMRATAQDAEVAQMMGVNVGRVIATTFLLGSMLAAAGGAMWGLNFGSLNQPAILGILPGIKAFAAAVIGGIGSLPGAVIGGLIIGFAENFLTAIFPRTPEFAGITEFKDTFAFILLIVILLVRPSGIIGEDLSEKV